MCVGRQHARAFGLSPFFRISLTSLAITTCLRSRARLEGLPFALASTTRSPPAPPRCRRPRCCCCRRRRRVCRPLAAANRNSNNTNYARLTLFAHTSLFVCLFATVCVCVCVCTALAARGHSLWAVSCGLCMCICVCVDCGLWAVWAAGVCFKNSLLHVYFQSSRNAPMLCAAASSFCRRSFWHRAFSLSLFLFLLSRVLSHTFALYAFFVVRGVCVHTYKHTYICFVVRVYWNSP